MKPEKEKIWLETGFKVITLLSHTDLSVDEQNVLHTRLLPLFKEMYEAGKSEAIELGDELIEQYFDKPASVFWDKLKGELTK